MSQDFFKYLPSEIISNILFRLPAKATMSCKCVCKLWLDLLTTPEFVKLHLSNSIPGLAVFNGEQQSKPFKIFEFVDELALKFYELRWDIVFKMDFPFHEPLHSSADGLLFLCEGSSSHPCDLFLCNPVNREYIKLPPPRQHYSEPWFDQMNTFGFGVSRITGQYKVVRMFLDEKLSLAPLFQCDQYECQVYTIGTGSWRRIASGMPLMYIADGGTFLNGNLHFLAMKGLSFLVSCLDLETELFNTFSTPPLPSHDDPPKERNLSVLRDCLCVCDNSGVEIDIWLMKEYGDVKSWTKEFAIHNVYEDIFLGMLCPLKVFKNGDILMELDRTKLLYYTSHVETLREVEYNGWGSNADRSTTIYAPSFVPLKTFAMENVSLF